MRTFLRLDAAVLAVAAVVLLLGGQGGWALLAAFAAVDAVALSVVPSSWVERLRRPADCVRVGHTAPS